jgi:hypothetical protein
MHEWTCKCSQCIPVQPQRQFRTAATIGSGRASGVLSETKELELALELLDVSSEAELEQFLGNVFKNIGKAAKGLAKGPLGGVLKSLAKKALPFVGGALGSFIPIPGVGTALGTALGSAASAALEMEFQGIDREVAELEMAQRFVRIAADAANAMPSEMGEVAHAGSLRAALTAAMRRHLPQARLQLPGMPQVARGPGTWARQGS